VIFSLLFLLNDSRLPSLFFFLSFCICIANADEQIHACNSIPKSLLRERWGKLEAFLITVRGPYIASSTRLARVGFSDVEHQ